MIFKTISFLKDSVDFWLDKIDLESEYHKVASSDTSRLEAHAGFQIVYKGDFQALCSVTFCHKVDFLISNARVYGK